MTMPADDGATPAGFAGLNSLVSKVEGDISIPPAAPPGEVEFGRKGLDDAATDVASIQSSAIVPSPSPIESRPTATPLFTDSAARWAVAITIGVGVALFLYLGFGQKSRLPSTADAQRGAERPSQAFTATHAVAAISANVRTSPTSKSPATVQAARGQQLEILSTEGTFLKVRLPNGAEGFIARELVIPVADLARLMNLAPRQYVELRAGEQRVEKLLSQSATQFEPLVAAVYGLTNRSPNMAQYLRDLDASKKYDIEADTSAATWFSLSARAAIATENLEDAYWSFRAAIESDPTNGEYHVGFALVNFRQGNSEAVTSIGKVLPRLAPMTTNAWMIFGLGESLAPDGAVANGATEAFILAIKLSRNAQNTRKYFRDLALQTTNSRVRQSIYAALAEESSDPNLFSGVSNPSPQPTSR